MYRVSEDIFFLNISEQVEYLTKSFNKIGEEWDTKGKQWEEDFTKIKEEWATFKETMSSKIDAQDAKIATLEGKIQGLETKFNDYKASNDARLTSDETKIKANETTILEHTNSISAINKNIEKVNNNINDLNNNKQAKVDNNLTTTSKEVVKAINENKASAQNAYDIANRAYTKADTNAKNIQTLNNTTIPALDTRVESVENDLNLKQNITDNTLETTAKTIVGAINELKNSGGGSGGGSVDFDKLFPVGSIAYKITMEDTVSESQKSILYTYTPYKTMETNVGEWTEIADLAIGSFSINITSKLANIYSIEVKTYSIASIIMIMRTN